ncbi:hypothetical protein F5051DRAFT_421179 [Lentinula edodes]|nr:hypothetical protein F5051DRAFT_421179 [Lentinula edodes]
MLPCLAGEPVLSFLITRATQARVLDNGTPRGLSTTYPTKSRRRNGRIHPRFDSGKFVTVFRRLSSICTSPKCSRFIFACNYENGECSSVSEGSRKATT